MNLMFEPSSIALRPAFMIIGPSATGSENGTPLQQCLLHSQLMF